MKEGDVVVGRLVLTDENAPAAVQPAVSAFHDPAARFEPSFPFDGLSLFAATPDVSGEAELVQRAAHFSEVVALVQAQTLGMRWARAGRGTGRRSTVARTSFMSWRLAPSTASPTGIPWASVNRLRLTPRLPRSVGLGPVFSPAQGRLGHGPIQAQPTPVQTLQFVIAFQSHPPKLQEYPGGDPFLKAQMGGGAGANARCVQGFPLAAGAQHVEDAVGASPVWNPRPAAAQRMGVHSVGKQRGQHLP